MVKGSTVTCSYSSLMKVGVHVFVQCDAVHINFILAIYKGGAGNSFLQL